MITRREFLKIGAAAGAGMMLPLGMANKLFAFNLLGQALPADPRALTKYIDYMPIPGVMPSDAPNYYEVGVHQFLSQVHSQMAPTTTWVRYRPNNHWTPSATPEATYLGSSFVGVRGTPDSVKWTNNLVDAFNNPIPHPLPVDTEHNVG